MARPPPRNAADSRARRHIGLPGPNTPARVSEVSARRRACSTSSSRRVTIAAAMTRSTPESIAVASQNDHDARGWLLLRQGALPAGERADHRALLSLHALPAPDRHGVRAQRADRG